MKFSLKFMSRLLSMSVVLTIAMMSMVFTACGDDEEDIPPTPENAVVINGETFNISEVSYNGDTEDAYQFVIQLSGSGSIHIGLAKAHDGETLNLNKEDNIEFLYWYVEVKNIVDETLFRGTGETDTPKYLTGSKLYVKEDGENYTITFTLQFTSGKKYTIVGNYTGPVSNYFVSV